MKITLKNFLLIKNFNQEFDYQRKYSAFVNVSMSFLHHSQNLTGSSKMKQLDFLHLWTTFWLVYSQTILRYMSHLELFFFPFSYSVFTFSLIQHCRSEWIIIAWINEEIEVTYKKKKIEEGWRTDRLKCHDRIKVKIKFAGFIPETQVNKPGVVGGGSNSVINGFWFHLLVGNS